VSEIYKKVIYSDIAATSLQVTPILLTWQETVSYQGFLEDDIVAGTVDPEEVFFLIEATERIPDLVKPGDVHYRYDQAYAVATAFEPMTADSSTHVRQRITYQKPGPKCSVQYDAYQATESRNFAEDNSVSGTDIFGSPQTSTLTTVRYRPSFSGPTINVAVPFVASLKVPSVMKCIRVTQYEVLTYGDASPAVVSDSDRPLWNADEIWGYEAGRILFVGVQSISDGTPIYRRTYTFLINEFGCDHMYAVWVDARGLKPQDITPISPGSVSPDMGTVRTNGAAAFRMLPSVNFHSYFSQIKPPFNG
jgi:hypothetical protein